MKSSVIFISDLVTPVTFKKLEQQLIEKNFSVEHGVIGDFIGEIAKAPIESSLLLHFTPFFISRRRSKKELTALCTDILKVIQSRLKISTSPIFINEISHSVSPISREEMNYFQSLVHDFNLKILDLAQTFQNLYIIETFDILKNVNFESNTSQKNYDIMGSPYSMEVCNLLSNIYKANLESLYTIKKKVIVVDADNTLWGGVIGEDGVAGVKIGNTYPGTVFIDFQLVLLSLKKSGYLLCLSTKNNEADVQEMFSIREMPLSLKDFIIIKANWQPKSENIRNIATELNISEDSIIFIDDNPFEIDEVKSSLPNVECLLFDQKVPLKSSEIFKNRIDVFKDTITQEDKTKTDAYKTEQNRRLSSTEFRSEEEFLGNLNLEIQCFMNETAHIPRASQMTMKTNQFNLTTRRYSESEIANLMKTQLVLTFSARDKYGDLGIIGLVIAINDEIDSLLLSCRAFGRKIEHFMYEKTKKMMNGRQFCAVYVPTKKNIMVSDFYEKCGMLKISQTDEYTSYRSQ